MVRKTIVSQRITYTMHGLRLSQVHPSISHRLRTILPSVRTQHAMTTLVLQPSTPMIRRRKADVHLLLIFERQIPVVISKADLVPRQQARTGSSEAAFHLAKKSVVLKEPATLRHRIVACCLCAIKALSPMGSTSYQPVSSTDVSKRLTMLTMLFRMGE